MKPGKLDLPVIWRGCDWPKVVLKWKDPDGKPFDLTGWQPHAFTKSNYDLHAQITNAEGGVTQMVISRANTAKFKLGVEQWDWIWENISDPDAPYRYPPFLSGNVTIKDPVTATPLPIVIPP